ncbi:MAG: GMP synthase [Cellvibrionaceae bacterium]
MIIGVLEAETLPPHVVERFGSYGQMFAELLQGLDPELDFLYYAADQGQLPHGVDACDAYILTGSRHNAFDNDPWIENLKHFICKVHGQSRKCLGVCFGHQLVAEALGGKVINHTNGWGIGVTRFSVGERPPWMSESTDSFRILVSHQDQVSQLPPCATLFAHSEFCPNGGYFVGQHIFCLQGHPEFNRDYLRFLINKRARLIGESKTEQALKSLHQPVDRSLFRSWIADFLGLPKRSHHS